jgi:hypothetical protein
VSPFHGDFHGDDIADPGGGRRPGEDRPGRDGNLPSPPRPACRPRLTSTRPSPRR